MAEPGLLVMVVLKRILLSCDLILWNRLLLVDGKDSCYTIQITRYASMR